MVRDIVWELQCCSLFDFIYVNDITKMVGMYLNEKKTRSVCKVKLEAYKVYVINTFGTF